LQANDDPLRVDLSRTVELEGPRLQLREWPGQRGPLVHVPDPRAPAESSCIAALADGLAPQYRVLSLQPRGVGTYQVDAADLLAMLDAFGFRAPVLLAEGLGCVPAVLVAAWYARRIAGLVLVDPEYQTQRSEGDVRAYALTDCPPDWAALRARLSCPVLVVSAAERVVKQVGQFLESAYA
jgi:pimeloyl-ACP methyl ester carboxylesterase